ncbi:MAG: DUF4881 domain-containing protein [Desulfobacterales bacterium]|nr:DUF4881 domain-containing protein [Desulfobacterales bacterium]
MDMIKPLRSLGLLIFWIGCVLIYGCGEMGKVDQGRVIEYNKEKRTVTIIRDSAKKQGSTDYSVLPPVTYDLPTEWAEMGPEPKPGMRMKLDTDKHQVVIFVPTLQNFATINYTVVEQRDNVQSSDPALIDPQTKKTKQFPIFDKGKKTITLYSKRQKILTTFQVPDEYFALPEYVWDAGDEVRIYYKEEGKARRFMNITKTDIFKK